MKSKENNEFCSLFLIYEELLYHPYEMLFQLLKFIGLDNKQDTILKMTSADLKYDKINPHRAYAHQKRGIKSSVNYDEMIRRIIKWAV